MKACEMNAAFGLVQLKRFEKFASIENKYRKVYKNLQVSVLTLPDDTIKPNWLAMPLKLSNVLIFYRFDKAIWKLELHLQEYYKTSCLQKIFSGIQKF